MQPLAQSRPTGLAVRLAWLLAAVYLALVVHGGVTDSQTFDEGVHLASGVTYWTTGDFRLNPEHPVLWKLVAALPVLTTRPTVPLDHPAWSEHREWDFASSFMRDNRVPTTTLLFLGRIPTWLAGASLVLILFYVGRAWFGVGAGLVASALAAFDPTLLAHGRYITTDVPVALMLVLTIAQLRRFVQRPDRRRTVWLFVCLTLAFLVKYSALYLLIVVPVTLLILRRRHPELPAPVSLTLKFLGGALVIIFAVYGFRFQSMHSDPRVDEIFSLRQEMIDQGTVTQQPALIQQAIRATEEGQPLRALIDRVGQIPLPFYWYIRGTAAVFSHAYWGQHAYLLGQISERGWSWYFPVAFLVKMPAATIGLLLVSIIIFRRTRARGKQGPWQDEAVILGMPLLLYGLASVTSRLNLGIRHLLPMFPLLFLGVGAAWERSRGLKNPRWRLAMLVLLVLLPLSVLRTHPRELAYFSELIGGERQGYRYLLDSNLDWGQDLIRLRSVLEQKGIKTVALSYAGTADPHSYGIRTEPFPHAAAEAVDRQLRWAAISIGNLMGDRESYAWIEQYPVSARVGSSILLFSLGEKR